MKRGILRLAETTGLLALVLVAGWAALNHWQVVTVAGGSMRPALAPGDVVVVDRTARARGGQIALVNTARHGRFLHRVIEVGATGLVRTRGDANTIADFDSVPASAVTGPVVMVVPVGRLVERWRGNGAYATMTAQQNSARQ